MDLKRYRVNNIKEALKFIKRDLGPDALIISTRQVKDGKGAFGMFRKNMLEVTAASSKREGKDKKHNISTTKAIKSYGNTIDFKDDMGANFMICSQAFVKKSGSSFGTLIAFSFMNISKNLKGKTECNHEDIISIFETSLKTILERGKTNLGDKTIADSLNLII